MEIAKESRENKSFSGIECKEFGIWWRVESGLECFQEIQFFLNYDEGRGFAGFALISSNESSNSNSVDERKKEKWSLIGSPPFQKFVSISVFRNTQVDSTILFLGKFSCKNKEKRIEGICTFWKENSSPLKIFPFVARCVD